MDSARKTSVSAAAFALICFFLPWAQLSCMGLKDSASGLDLARGNDGALWLAPIFMLAVIGLGLARFVWDRAPAIFASVGMIGGAFSAYLMYREYSSSEDSALPIAMQWTVWFWLGLAASILVAVSAFMFYVKRARSP